MKRAVAILLTFCLLFSMIPIMPVWASGDRLTPPDDVIFKTDNGELEIGFNSDSLTKNQKDWLKDIGDIEINGCHYKESNGNYSFVKEQDRVVIGNHNLILPENEIKILASKYEAYTKTYVHPSVKKMIDGLKIENVTLATAGDDLKTSECISIRLDYEYNSSENAALNTLIMRGLKSMTIDGKVFSARDSQDARQSFFLKNTVVSMYDQTPDGKVAVEHFKKRDNHQIIMTFVDDSELTYEDSGYVADEEDKDPSQVQAVDENTGGMAAGWGFVKFEQAANNWNGAKMESELPRDQWYEKYIKNIRCVFVDDLYIADRQESPSDVTLQGEVLTFATYGRVFDGEPHKLVVVFKDDSRITHIDVGYEKPEEPKDLDQYLKDKPTIKDEPVKPITGEASQKYIFEFADFKKEWGDPEIIVRFKEIEAKTALRDMQSFTVNGKTYQDPDLWMVSYKGLICNAQEVITPLYGKDKLDLTIIWRDGTHSTISKAINPVKNPKEPEKTEKEPELSKEEQVLKDEQKNVKITVPAEALPKDVVLKVVAKEVQEAYPSYAKAVADKSKVTAFDISFSWANKDIQPKKTVSVSLPIGSHDPKTLVVHHIDQDGKVEKVEPIQVDGNEITFSADRFSTYALASGKKEKEEPEKTKEKLAILYPIDKVALEKASWNDSKYMRIYLKNYKQPNDKEAREALVKAFREATFTLNGQDFTNLTVNANYDKIEIFDFDEAGQNLKKAWEAAGEEAKIKIKFSDGSIWKNYQETVTLIAEKLAITDVKEKMKWTGTEVDSLVIQSKGTDKMSMEERTALAQEIAKASWTVNGVKLTDIAVGYTRGLVEGYEIYNINTDFYEAYAKQKPASLSVTFKDGSRWDNGIAVGSSTDKNKYNLTETLPDGEYTLSFDISKADGTPTVMARFLDKKAKLTVEKGKKKVTFLITSNANLLFDFAIGKDGCFVSAEDTVFGNEENHRKTYTGSVEALDQAYELAILNPMMKGQASDKGNFDKYTKVDLVFKSPVVKGWEGFTIAEKPEFDQKKNDDNLRLKLISQRVDTNGDGEISKEELQNAKGKLDLSGETIGASPDVSILKDLGPGVTELYLDANGIESLPEGFFDNMTGIGQISLSGNKLTDLPKNAFDKNTKLHTLWMEGNRLTVLDSTLFAKNPGLLELAISRNQIATLPKGLLVQNTKLKQLYASDNGLTDIDEGAFGDMKRLEKLQLGNNRLTSLPDVIGEFCRLEEINLENNLLIDMPKGMDKLGNLCKVNLSNNFLKDIDESFWLRMSRNAINFNYKYPNLDVSGNRLTDIPFDAMLQQKAKFNKFDVSRNYLPAKISSEEADKLQRLGIAIGDGMTNCYQPQMTAMGASLKAKEGQLTLTQDMDMLQIALWNHKDFNDWDNFLDPESYLTFVKDRLYKKYHITTINDHLGFAQILNKMGMDWQIRTIIEKKDGKGYRKINNELLVNEGHNGQISDVDPVDADTFTFVDANMQIGDQYRLTRILTTKVGAGPYYVESLRYSVEATAASKAPDTLTQKATAWDVPIQVLYEDKDDPSMAGKVFSDQVKVETNDNGYATTITFKPLKIGLITGYMQSLDLYETKDDQTLGKVRALPLTNIQKDAKGMTSVTFVSKEKPQELYYATVYFTIGEPNGKNTNNANVRIVLNWDQAKVSKNTPSDEERSAAQAALEKAIAQAEAKLTDGKVYTDVSRQAVEKALAKAKTALAKDAATMKEATVGLEKAIGELKEKPSVDQKKAVAKAALEKAIAQAEAKLTDGKVYTDVSRQAVEKALAKAKTALAKDAATMKEATVGLEKAIGELKEKPSVDQKKAVAKAALEKAIAQAEAKLTDGKVYTDVSRQAVEKALVKAKAALDKDTASMQAARQALDKTVKALAVDSASESEKKAIEAKELKALVQEAEELIKDKKNTNKDLTKLKAAVQKAKVAKSPEEKEKAKKILIKALIDFKQSNQQKKEDQSTRKVNKKHTVTHTSLGGFKQSGEPQKVEQPSKEDDKKYTLIQPKGGYISGYPNGTFRPERLVTRAEAAAMLSQFVSTNHKADQLPKDVSGTTWYTDSLRTLIGAGLLSGYGDGTIRSEKTMTRAEMIALIGRMKGITFQESHYTDLAANHWAYKAVGGAQAAGIINGYPDGSFKPDQAVTRAEMVTMVNRTFGYSGSTSVRNFTDLTSGHWAYKEIQKAARA